MSPVNASLLRSRPFSYKNTVLLIQLSSNGFSCRRNSQRPQGTPKPGPVPISGTPRRPSWGQVSRRRQPPYSRAPLSGVSPSQPQPRSLTSLHGVCAPQTPAAARGLYQPLESLPGPRSAPPSRATRSPEESPHCAWGQRGWWCPEASRPGGGARPEAGMGAAAGRPAGARFREKSSDAQPSCGVSVYTVLNTLHKGS